MSKKSKVRLADISVTRLFGIFDHQIHLRTDERITIIHGPNGFGKTIILRMVYSVMTGQTAFLAEVPFESFVLTFTDGTIFTIRRELPIAPTLRNPQKVAEPSSTQVVITLAEGTDLGPFQLTDLQAKTFPDEMLREIDRFVPGPYYRLGDGWTNRDTDEK